jgi:hypothetical protein
MLGALRAQLKDFRNSTSARLSKEGEIAPNRKGKEVAGVE